MNTEYFDLKNCPNAIFQAAIARAAEHLKNGRLVAFPTETVYGLGANGLDAAACQAVYRAKKRPGDNPLILHVATKAGLEAIVRRVTPTAEKLIAAFMPGPLTLILPKAQAVPLAVTGGLDTVAVRMPDHPVARALIAASRLPVAAPSANLSGRPSPTDAATVLADLSGRIACVLDGGQTDCGLESTIVDCTEKNERDSVTILRPGFITAEMLREIVTAVHFAPLAEKDENRPPPAPGMKYTHYAPRQPLTVAADGERLMAEYRRRTAAGETVGLIVSDETADKLKEAGAIFVFSYGEKNRLKTIAFNLYRALRAFDESPVTSLLAEAVPETGYGLAIMNRLLKAAGGRTI